MYPGRSNWSLLTEAALGAIRDAGLRKDDIDGLICQEAFNSLTVAEYTKIKPKFTLSMTVHGATAAASLTTAAMAVSAGLANYVLCVMGGTRDPESGGQQPGGFRTVAAMAAGPPGGGGRARLRPGGGAAFWASGRGQWRLRPHEGPPHVRVRHHSGAVRQVRGGPAFQCPAGPQR